MDSSKGKGGILGGLRGFGGKSRGRIVQPFPPFSDRIEAGCMRATFPLFIVSRCLCFTRPSRVAVHDKAAKGGITEGTNNVMYYT